MIIQGTNEPIVLDFPYDMTKMQAFSAVLVLKRNNREMKRWTKDDLIVGDVLTDEEGNVSTLVSLPMTESETLGFDYGVAILQFRWLMDGDIYTAESEQFIKRWYDKAEVSNANNG